jgi:hypothetical protein
VARRLQRTTEANGTAIAKKKKQRRDVLLLMISTNVHRLFAIKLPHDDNVAFALRCGGALCEVSLLLEHSKEPARICCADRWLLLLLLLLLLLRFTQTGSAAWAPPT